MKYVFEEVIVDILEIDDVYDYGQLVRVLN